MLEYYTSSEHLQELFANNVIHLPGKLTYASVIWLVETCRTLLELWRHLLHSKDA
jgi:hypothetical protein